MISLKDALVSSSLVLHGTGRLGKGAHRDQGATRTTGEKARRTQSKFSAQGGRTLWVCDEIRVTSHLSDTPEDGAAPRGRRTFDGGQSLRNPTKAPDADTIPSANGIHTGPQIVPDGKRR